MSTYEFIRNSAALLAVLVALYYFARVVAYFGDAQTARMLAPFAPLLGAVPQPGKPYLIGQSAGRRVRLSLSPGMNVGKGEITSRINAIHLQVLDLPGKKDWWLQFHVTGLLGQGIKELGIGAREDGLAERVRLSGITAEVEKVSAPTDTYITVSYEAFAKTLTYTDDVSPRKVPTPEALALYLPLVERLAVLNAEINAA